MQIMQRHARKEAIQDVDRQTESSEKHERARLQVTSVNALRQLCPLAHLWHTLHTLNAHFGGQSAQDLCLIAVSVLYASGQASSSTI